MTISATSNAVDFEAKFRKLAERLGPNVASRQQRYAAELITELVQEVTPVWSGQARANWIVGLNHTPEGYVKIPRPTKDKPPEPEKYFAVSLSLELSVINTARYRDAIHIVNHVPYILRLNAGYSPQAEARFVQATVDRVRSHFRGTLPDIISLRFS